jgi:3-hydroxyisobutyrate dehydrogenase
MNVAVLGTGIMGAPMARNLASAGHEVRAWNRTPAKAEGLGATVASTPAQAVEGADVVITMLADGPTVAAVMGDVRLGDDVVWWQASTVGVEWPGQFAPHVDGPVMGTRKPAEDGKLTVLASGPGRERLGEVFEPVSAKVIDLGDEIGAGQRMKLVGNAWVLGLVEALAETIALAERLGVDPRDFLAMIEGGLMDTP